MRSTFTQALRIFAVVFCTSVAHRIFTFAPLAEGAGVSLDGLATTQALLVGFLSDFWVAYLAAFVAVPAMLLLRRQGRQRKLAVAWSLTLIAAAMLHQAYVDFFHFQIIPAHIEYLLDADFVAANSRTAMNWKGLGTAMVGLAVLFVTGRKTRHEKSSRVAAAAFGLLTVLALGAHNRNIHYRVQWFVPEGLQANGFERLYLNFKTAKKTRPLSDSDLSQLASSFGVAPLAREANRATRLASIVTRPTPTDAEMSPLGRELKASWTSRVAAGAKPVLQVVLLESLRPAETGFLHPEKSSLTPSLDSLAATGVAFSRAYSYGIVTRGAQEAAFCGYLGSQDTSLMRGRSELTVECLTDLVSREAGDLFWLHGGEGRFDGQKAFWQRRHIPNVMTIEDFPADAPRTGWGIADGAFFIASAAHLERLRSTSRSDYLAGMLLSVSNHIPWDLPADAPHDIAAKEAAHPSFKTTAYSDWALGQYTEALKARGLWQDSLLIIMSDHGTTAPPYAGDEEEPELKTHVNLVIAGGIVDSALQAQQLPRHLIDRPTAQADVAAFIAYLLSLTDARAMGESLFIAERRLPIVADLGRSYYLPALSEELSVEEALTLPSEALKTELRVPVLYNRAFLELLNVWSQDPGALQPARP